MVQYSITRGTVPEERMLPAVQDAARDGYAWASAPERKKYLDLGITLGAAAFGARLITWLNDVSICSGTGAVQALDSLVYNYLVIANAGIVARRCKNLAYVVGVTGAFNLGFFAAEYCLFDAVGTPKGLLSAGISALQSTCTTGAVMELARHGREPADLVRAAAAYVGRCASGCSAYAISAAHGCAQSLHTRKMTLEELLRG
jgi:hypothetical protein